MKSFFMSAAVLAMSTGAALSADLGPYRAPPPPAEPVYSEAPKPEIWRGLYVGVNGGYGWADTGSLDADGFFGGGTIGYNAQFNSLVIGIEGDFQAADFDEDRFSNFGGGFSGRAQSDIDWFSTVRGRIGFAANRTLIYATGGVAFADIDTRAGFTDGVTDVAFSNSDTKTGYAVGAGIEYALSQNWSMKAEYLYLDFGSDTVNALGSDGNTYSTKIDTDIQTVRLGLNYKF